MFGKQKCDVFAAGGTAVGTGLNTTEGFDEKVAQQIAQLTGKTHDLMVIVGNNVSLLGT